MSDRTVEDLVGSLDAGQREQLTRLLARPERVAVIGMACRFPGADSPEEYWRLLLDGKHAITEQPADRSDLDAHYHPEPGTRGKHYNRHGGFISDIADFDADFFGLSAREASAMDPQQRLLLELSWEAMERAGQSAEALAGSLTGVYVGICGDDYVDRELRSGDPGLIDVHTLPGTIRSVTAGRLSYALNLRGPSTSVDTACSSSLVAIHLGVQALLAGECDLALAAGTNLILGHEYSVYFSVAGLLAPDGRVKAFDAAGNGFVRSEGCGVVVLKRLSEAVRDGDPVHAVVDASVINHNGAGNGLAAPSVVAQRELLARAIGRAGIDPANVGFVEAHGTGTVLGDAIELDAVRAVYGAPRPSGMPCYVGSGKTNIGHMEAAAGVGGFIKAVLAVQHGLVPGNLHFSEPNPHIPVAGTAIAFPTDTVAFPAQDRRVAGVSSFGYGGTNAHVILSEPPTRPSAPRVAERPRLLPVSAATAAAVRESAERYSRFLASSQGAHQLAAVCHTAGTRRVHHKARAVVVASSLQEAIAGLDAARRDLEHPDVVTGERAGRRPQVGFVFGDPAAQAASLIAAAERLLAAEPSFADAFARRTAEIHRSLHGVGADRQAFAAKALLLATQLAIADLWRSWGVVPHAAVGVGLGRLAAARLTGRYTAEDLAAALVGSPRGGGFADGADDAELVEHGCTLVLDVGVGSGLVRVPGGTLRAGAAAPDPLRDLLRALGELYVRGVDVDWSSLNGSDPLDCVPLPTYPFQRRRFWLSRPDKSHPLLGRADLRGTQRVWDAKVSLTDHPYLAEHRVYGVAVFPAAGHLEAAIAAAADMSGEDAVTVRDVELPTALALTDDRRTVQVVVDDDRFTLRSRHAGGSAETGWVIHSTASLVFGDHDVALERSIPAIAAEHPDQLDIGELYDTLRARNVEYGETFRALENVWLGPTGALGRITVLDRQGHHLHPAVLDACFQVFAAADAARTPERTGPPVLPVGIDEVRVQLRAGAPRWSQVVSRPTGHPDTVAADVFVLDGSGAVVAEVRGLRGRRPSGASA